MTIHRLLVTIQRDSGIPADAITNSFHFDGSGADTDNVFDIVEDFYNTVPTGGTLNVASLLSQDLANTGATMKLYRLSDPKPRVPRAERTWEPDITGSGGSLPAEVALVASFRAAYESGKPTSRRRNRVYIGPLRENVNVHGQPYATAIETINKAMTDMKAAADASISWEWVCYSPKDNEGHSVIGGWVDNAFDSQRRRGEAPTLRFSWP